VERRQKIEEDEGMSYEQFSAMEMGWKWKHPIPMKEPLLLFMAANVLVAIHQWISAFKLKIIFGGICGMVSITLLLFIYWTFLISSQFYYCLVIYNVSTFSLLLFSPVFRVKLFSSAIGLAIPK
jgi:hypothetical protein